MLCVGEGCRGGCQVACIRCALRAARAHAYHAVCTQTPPPPRSVDPSVGFCVQCDAKTPANCTGVAPIPARGYWASHPRSPLVHRCLVDAACAKAGPGAGEDMFAWAVAHKDLNISQLAAVGEGGRPLFEEYTELMCSPGYEVRCVCVCVWGCLCVVLCWCASCRAAMRGCAGVRLRARARGPAVGVGAEAASPSTRARRARCAASAPPAGAAAARAASSARGGGRSTTPTTSWLLYTWSSLCL